MVVESNYIQSICYERGSLRLLDERKLPLETVYLDIRNATDGCRPTAVNLSNAAGSRLIAFELVHEKIPATLIADSAAAALMKAGRVNAVIVGADSVASNGDTANKIGTYSLALCAFHHKIPFYVAAPITSIDLSLSSGNQIFIAERSAKELLRSEGGLVKQVAAHLNPSVHAD